MEKLSRASSIDLPPEGYFDGLAGRIDARLAKEDTPIKESFLIRLFKPRPRVVAAFGTLAAIFLVVIIANRIFNPTTEQIVPIPSQKINSMPTPPKEQVIDSFALRDEVHPESKSSAHGKQSQAPLKKSPKPTPTTVPKSNDVQGKVESVELPEESKVAETTRTMNVPANAPSEPPHATVVTAPRDLLKLSENSQLHLNSAGNDVARRAETDLSLQDILPLDSNGSKIEDPDTIASRVEALLATGQYLKAPVKGEYVSLPATQKSLKVGTTALSNQKEESDEAWLNNLHAVDLAQWETEVQYRYAKTNPSISSIVVARVYIQHYLSTPAPINKATWNERLDSLKSDESSLRKKLKSDRGD
jgi:hypothetical protein